MKFKSFDELKEIIARNASRIMNAVEQKYGRQEDDFPMEFAFPAPDGSHYHCVLTVANGIILSFAYGFNGNTGIDLGRPGSEPDNADFIMQDLADDLDRCYSDPDAFISIDLTAPDDTYTAWDPMEA